MTQSAAADPATAQWTDLIVRYYNGCSAGDVAAIKATLHPDVVHWFLAPNQGYQMRPQASELDGFPYGERGYAVAGAERSRIHPDAAACGP